ncbi:putative RNA methyltransferase [Ammoniphilus oxalaticus]|uniref:putative RNA methyltransferase n=1 Tax=Ammoniphilus oxalaticus TaxID=66863 RepID=UPI001FE75B75|nr:methyltransferase domain-containing protein [Ammoniphilus oxalaticus]
MFEVNKRIRSAKFVSRFESIFKCPICNLPMHVFELKSLLCSNNHTFDFARQGYINLTTRQIQSKYSKKLFEARRKLIIEDGFFKPMNRAITDFICQHAPREMEPMSIIDMGCGEGSHLSNICDAMSSYHKKTVTGVGVDISKDGISLASRDYDNKIWIVADLVNTPFRDQQFDVILNILSPSNYAEFNRLLKTDGIVIKVIPQAGYLQELRKTLFDTPEKQVYSNVDTVELFSANYQVIDCLRSSYTVTLNRSSVHSLLMMTPLSWDATENQIRTFLKEESTEVTVDLDVLVGKRRN